MSAYLCNDQTIQAVANAVSIVSGDFVEAFVDSARQLGYPCTTLAHALKLANLLALEKRYGEAFEDADIGVYVDEDCALGADIADQIGCLAYQCAEFSERDNSAKAVFVNAVIKNLYLCRDGYTTGAMQKIMRLASDAIDKAKVTAAQAVPAAKLAAQAAAPVVAQEVQPPAEPVKPSKPVAIGGVRAMRHYMTDGKTKVKVRYHASTDYKTGQSVVWVHQQDYGYELFAMLGDVCRNETDSQTDYFDKTSAKLTPVHPMYAECLKRARESDSAWQERQAKRRAR